MSNRDAIVLELMRYMRVDSWGHWSAPEARLSTRRDAAHSRTVCSLNNVAEQSFMATHFDARHKRVLERMAPYCPAGHTCFGFRRMGLCVARC